MEAAELAWSTSNPEALNEALNPYRINRQLKEIVPNEDFIPLDPTVHAVTIDGQQKRASWNLDSLRDKGKIRSLTVKDLPAVSASILEETFAGLRGSSRYITRAGQGHIKTRNCTTLKRGSTNDCRAAS